MAKSPTHYTLTVKKPAEVAGIQLRPGARYTVKAAVHDALKKAEPDAIDQATAHKRT